MLGTCSLLIPNTITAEVNEVQKDQTCHFLHCCILKNIKNEQNQISRKKTAFFGLYPTELLLE